MDQSDKDILALEIVDKRECILKSSLLEVTGFRKAMRDLDNAGVNVVEVVTDAHPQISKVMSKLSRFSKVLFIKLSHSNYCTKQIVQQASDCTGYNNESGPKAVN